MPAVIPRLFIQFYQRVISPLLPPSCRFQPTCSEYALEALKKHGLFRGGLLAAWRILRCNPFGRFGFDPVPERDKKGATCCRPSKDNPKEISS